MEQARCSRNGSEMKPRYYELEVHIEYCPECSVAIPWREWIPHYNKTQATPFALPVKSKRRFKRCCECAARQWAVKYKQGRAH